MDQITDLGPDRHGRQSAEKYLFPVGHGDDLFPLQRQQAQENHFAPAPLGIPKPQFLQFANKLLVDSPHVSSPAGISLCCQANLAIRWTQECTCNLQARKRGKCEIQIRVIYLHGHALSRMGTDLTASAFSGGVVVWVQPIGRGLGIARITLVQTRNNPSGTKGGFTNGWMGITDEVRVPPRKSWLVEVGEVTLAADSTLRTYASSDTYP